MSDGNNLSNFTTPDIICLQENISYYYGLTIVTREIPSSCFFKYYLEDTHNIISYKLPMENIKKIPHE